MAGKLSIKFYPHPAKVKAGKHQVFLRIIFDRKKAEIATDLYCAPDKWEDFSTKNQAFDEEQARLKREIYRIKNRLQEDGKAISAQIIKEVLNNRQPQQMMLVDYFEKYISRINALKSEYTHDNVRKYVNTKDYLVLFLSTIRNRKDVGLTEVNFKFVADFDHFLMTYLNPKLKRTLERNTVNQHHTRLRTILIRASREGLLTKNPYHEFKLTDVVKPPKYLTEEELYQLSTHSLGENASLQRVRDIFLFSVYTGLRFSDAQQLRMSQIQTDKEGNSFIYIEKQEKTEQPVLIPLLAPAVAIVEKYNELERKVTGFVLPRISNQKTNTYLKTIAALAGIKKKLTHHVARHTCATTILMNNDVSLEDVSEWLGHRDLKNTQVYGKITGKRLSRIARQVEKNFK